MSNIVPTQKDLSTLAIANNLKIDTIDDLQRLGEILSRSGFFEDCKQAAQAVVKILAGAELGFPAFSSMCGIYIIKGKPAIGANLMAAAVKRSVRYDYRVLELSDRICKIAFFDGDRETGRSEFSAADAQKAGTQNMGKFPRNMLFARAMSNGCRWFVPDIFLGAAVYTPEELGATVDEEGNVIEISPSPPSVQLPPNQKEIYRSWRSVSDAISWASECLPHLTVEEIQAHFDALDAPPGRKAPAWITKVNELKQVYMTSDEQSPAQPSA
ncbi:hypothetical protein [Chroococcidiopsis sp. CCNUC1]|uniref:hypothetical protein n=1 Tax=Chroococcidiopsis sp. CCNUC1 TaxID=2653189 RepID=UPI002020B740|nr:hypothetical protein [Chroococcidiopsis sp. CCNUC1]URD53716.1 hypothetical protein M5J74_31970 [Chroococcidiopsis sp. CCNUC1]